MPRRLARASAFKMGADVKLYDCTLMECDAPSMAATIRGAHRPAGMKQTEIGIGSDALANGVAVISHAGKANNARACLRIVTPRPSVSREPWREGASL
jgi:hypothetical protein